MAFLRVCVFVALTLSDYTSPPHRGCQGLRIYNVLFFFLRFYLFIHRDTHREKQRPRQREKQAPFRELDVGLDPRLGDHALSQRQVLHY